MHRELISSPLIKGQRFVNKYNSVIIRNTSLREIRNAELKSSLVIWGFVHLSPQPPVTCVSAAAAAREGEAKEPECHILLFNVSS